MRKRGKSMIEKFDEAFAQVPFRDHGEYMEYLFAAINFAMQAHLTQMKRIFATGQGGYKNVLYPDLETAADICAEKLERFSYAEENTGAAESESIEEDVFGDLSDDLFSLFGEFAEDTGMEKEESSAASELTTEGRMLHIAKRAEKTLEAGISLPFYELSRKLELEPFSVFCFAAGILASTQTEYAGVYQVINENGSLSAPTIEAAARLYYGDTFSIAGAYGEMSSCLEQLMPVLNLQIQGNMPFSTVVSPDKRIIDFLFGRNPMRLDENYMRFFKMLTDGKELNPIMANEGILEAMTISYEEGVRIFSYFGDEGSGRKFFVKKFCAEKGLHAVAINCKKLFIYDYQYVDQALWAVTRECILTNACCVLDELAFREEEKDKFYGYMDLAFGKLLRQGITVFTVSREKLQMKDITQEEFTELELPTPGNQEREDCWKYFSQGFGLGADVELPEMATKFLFTPGKIHAALKNARSLATMEKEILIPRKILFQGCYNQMSSELTQKATKVKANFGFEDIVMNKDQRETLEHAIDQMNFRKKVYDNWDYNKKYPYGRGLSILLFGAPGTGKSMCAQVPQVPSPTPHKVLGPGIDGRGIPRGPRGTRMGTGLS